MGFAVGLDIGGTTLKAGLVRADGRIHRSQRHPAPAHADDIVTAAVELVREIVAGDAIDAIGIGSPGTIDPITGVVVASDSKPLYEGANIGPAIGEAFGVPWAVTNDVNAIAVGELAFGIASGFSRILVIAVGTGVGGGLLINGRIEEGVHGTAGEVAHLLVGAEGVVPCGCGKADHLEAVAAGPAMERRYATRAEQLDLRQIEERLNAGDAWAREVVTDGGTWLGRAIAGLANALDIEALVLSGGVAQVEAYVEAARTAFTGEVMRPLRGVPVLVGSLGPDGGIIGAATYVRARLGL